VSVGHNLLRAWLLNSFSLSAFVLAAVAANFVWSDSCAAVWAFCLGAGFQKIVRATLVAAGSGFVLFRYAHKSITPNINSIITK
jgi:hypothetical protein